MVAQDKEYTSLRQELLEHQSRRLTILNVVLTICIALFAAGVQLQIKLLPLLALILLHMARVQIAEAQYGVARISSYIRIVLEPDNPLLNWESGSFWIRKDSLTTKTKEDSANKIWNIYPLAHLDWFIFWTSLIAIAISVIQSLPGDFRQWLAVPTIYYHIMNAFATIIWIVLWIVYSGRFKDLATMNADEKEGRKWEDYKKVIVEKRKSLEAKQADSCLKDMSN